MTTITNTPSLYLGFIALHLVLGQYGSALIYRLRFKGSPLVLYNNERAGQEHKRWTRNAAIAAPLWFGSVLAFAFWPAWRESTFGAPLFDLHPMWGWAVAGLGLVGMLTAQYTMGASFRVGQDERPEVEPHLVTTGWHKLSRNPIYLFSTLYIFGATLWAPSLVTTLTALAIAACIHGLVCAEERFLEDRLGEPYRAYCRRVRRYL